MAERIKILVQKRTSLKAQITGLTNALDKGKIDNITLKLRIAHLTDVYHAYEEFHDELLVLDPSGDHLTEFTNVQDRYYTLASRIESILNVANTSDNNCDTASVGTRNDNASSVSVTKIRRMKLPEAPLPTFDGKFEEWLAFKNAFTNMIGNQTDLSDVDKLHYFNGLMADDVQQHVASLATLGVTVGPEMIVYLIESKLPRSALDKWEATLQRDEFPKPEQLYEFLYKIAVCASRREKAKISDTERCKGEPPAKKLRTGSSNKAFVAKVSRNCIACKVKRHPLYLCEKFKQLPVSERIEKIKSANLCYNCLRSHRGTPCKFSSCTICQK
ncbi:hypothetical protein ALC62_01188 [Cyphomyrmex costatus]|uniref:Uncharacterized protein n=1 Tax=Cyphomyrmex costatus TaxID=456900 RepID=A0A151IPG6_9HYME|nr:hypothetical protein ALC62_01188 [Cyphomyrmex costatus]